MSVPRPPAIACLALFLQSACGSDVTQPSHLLLGEWGSAEAQLIAIRSGAELQFFCSTVIIDNPIQLTAEDSFETTGRLQPSTGIIGELPKVRVAGSTTGSTVTVTAPSEVNGTASTYELRSGVHKEPLTDPVCPL